MTEQLAVLKTVIKEVFKHPTETTRIVVNERGEGSDQLTIEVVNGSDDDLVEAEA